MSEVKVAQKEQNTQQAAQKQAQVENQEHQEQMLPIFSTAESLPSVIWRAQHRQDTVSQDDANYLQRMLGNQTVSRLMTPERDEGKEHTSSTESTTQAMQSILGHTTALVNKSTISNPAIPANNQTTVPHKSQTIQAKLQVNEIDDPYEKEADKVAETVMRMPASAPPPPPADDEQSNDNNDSIPTVQRQADPLGGTEVNPELESRVSGLNGKGSPLPDQDREFFESRMGADFSGVRVHTNSGAAQLSQDLNARAFTVGGDIAFGEGEYQPGSTDGRKLLAHELTHTVQQGSSAKRKVQREETEEELQAKSIQREEDEELQTKSIQRQEEAPTVGGEAEEGPTEEEKAAARAAAAQAEQIANAVLETSQSQTVESKSAAQIEQEAAAVPKAEIASSLAEGPIQDGKQKTQETAVTETALNSAQQAEPIAQEVITPTPKDSAPPIGADPAPVAPPIGGDPAAATANAQNAVSTAFATAENPPDKAPDTPQADPAYQSVVTATSAVTDDEKTHEPAAGEAASAQGAVVVPQAEVDSRAQGSQVGDMEAAETPGFDAAAFKAALMDRIAAAAPKTAEAADEFKENDALGGVQAEMQGQMAQERENAATPLAEAATAPPDTGAVQVREATPLNAVDPGPTPPQVGAENAAPPPRSTSEVESPISSSSQSLDQQMQEANITEDQLAQSNEPEFATALAAKGEAQTAAAEAPQTARQDESSLIASTQEAAVATATNALGEMHSQRTDGLTAVNSQQTETMSQDEQKRTEVAANITAIYDRTQTNVDTILSQLDTEVAQVFDAGAKEAEQAFEDYVDAKMDAYKEERYGGLFGWGQWLIDKIAGMPSEVNGFYSNGRSLYINKMDAVIDNVVAIIGRTLAEAKAAVATGKQEIQTYVDQLPDDLKSVGQEAADAIQGRFDELEGQIDAKQGELIDTLAQKYNDSLQSIDARIDEMKAANKGLIDKALDAVGGVIKTILELKEMLMNVLARVADAVMSIINDPIGFLGNLINAIQQGFGQFIDNIDTHLKKGLIGWLTGSIAEAGIDLPDNFDLQGIFQLVMQILGVSFEQIMGKVSKVLGFDVSGLYDKVMSIVEIYQEEGLMGLAKYGLTQLIGQEGVDALMQVVEIFDVIKGGDLGALWGIIQEHLTDLKEMVMGKVQEFIAERVIKAGITWLLSLFNPAGAFIKACKMIYDVVMFFIERGSQIMSLVNAIIDSVASIAAGNVGAAANFIEQALAKAIPVAISFLSSLLGLGNISGKVKEIIESVRGAVDNALDKILNSKPVQMVAGFIKKAIGKVQAFIQGGIEKVKGAVGLGDPQADAQQGDGKTGDGEVGETIKFNADGESHRLWYNVQGATATVMVASNPTPVETKIREWEQSLNENPDLYGDKVPQAKTLLASAKNLLGIADQEGDEAAQEKLEADQEQADVQQETDFEQADQQAEQAEQSLADVLMPLFAIFGEETPVLKGTAKTKFDQVMADRHIPDNLRNKYKDAVFTQLMQADESADQYGILKSVAAAAGGEYFAKGPEIPTNEIKAKGGMTRTVPLKTVWADNLDAAYKAQFGTFEAWLEALGEDTSLFNPNTHLDPGSTVPGQYATAWWAPRSQQQGNTMAELMEELALNPATYEGGCIRVTVGAETSQKAGFKKPTALDAIFFTEFTPAPNNVWGITGGGSLEAVAPKISLSDVTKKEFLPSNLPEGGSIEAKIKKNELPHLNDDGSISKEKAEQVAKTTEKVVGNAQITVQDGDDTWDYNVQRMAKTPKDDSGNDEIWNELNEIKNALSMPKSITYFEELVSQYQDNLQQALTLLKAEDSNGDIHPSIRLIRNQNGLGPNIKHSPTVAILEGDVSGLGNVSFTGISGKFGTTVTSDLRLNAVSPTHAEGRVLAQLANAMKAQNVQGGTITIYVDKPPCGFCKGALTTMKNQYDVTINIISP